MKWGVRRYQNPDGSLTAAGKQRQEKYSKKANIHDRAANAAYRDASDLRKNGFNKEADAVQKVGDRQKEKADRKRELQIAGKMTGTQKAVVGAAGALAAKSILDTAKNAAITNVMLDGYAELPLKMVASKGAVQAGKVAAIGALATYGTIKTAQFVKKKMDQNTQTYTDPDGNTWKGNFSDKTKKKMKQYSAVSGATATKAKMAYLNSSNNSKKVNSESSKEMFSRKSNSFDRAKKDMPSLTYDKIYKDMKADMTKEDPSYYRDLEDKWFKKHGY